MAKKDTFRFKQGNEVYKNNKFETHSSLQTFMENYKDNLANLLSIKIEAWNQIQWFYNIDTKDLSTYISTHEGIAPRIMQYNKKTKTQEHFKKYSDPGYDFFVKMLLSYYTVYWKLPTLDFSKGDKKTREKQKRSGDLPLETEMLNVRMDDNISDFFEQNGETVEDENGIKRIQNKYEQGSWDRTGFWIQEKNTLIKSKTGYARGQILDSTITFENELLPLYIQAFIDANRYVSGTFMHATLEKLYEMTQQLIDQQSFWNKYDEERIKIRRNL